MATKWVQTRFPGIRYREHETRKHGIKRDRYFSYRFKVNKKEYNGGLGWASEGWTLEKAVEMVAMFKANARQGKKPTSLAEMREIEEAKERVERLEREINERKNITFETYFNEIYYPTAQVSKKKSSYIKELQHFNRWLKPNIGHLPLRQITRENLENVIQKMEKQKKSIRLREYVLGTFQRVWNDALDRGYVSTICPAKKIKLPKYENARMRYLSRDEADKLLKALKKARLDLHDMALFALHTGARANEIFSLRWGDVNLDEGFVTLRAETTKSTRDRTIPLTEEVKNMLKDRGPGNRHDLIFLSAYGKPLTETPKLFKRVVDRLGFNCGVTKRERITFHSLRHTFATWHVLAGTPIHTLQKLMGHSTIKVTEKYLHVLDEHKVEAQRNFEKSLKKQKGRILEFPKAIIE